MLAVKRSGAPWRGVLPGLGGMPGRGASRACLAVGCPRRVAGRVCAARLSGLPRYLARCAFPAVLRGLPAGAATQCQELKESLVVYLAAVLAGQDICGWLAPQVPEARAPGLPRQACRDLRCARFLPECRKPGIPAFRARLFDVPFGAIFTPGDTSKSGMACRIGDISGFEASLKFLPLGSQRGRWPICHVPQRSPWSVHHV
jgi:hypothetical protein